jgi:prepilin-type processing-associated H-X9-DG protein/prepilin-type N-terminal cleavage/methylation domain-containing protein
MIPGSGSPSRRGRRHRRGLTLIELVVVIACTSILLALSAPAVQAAREAARRVACTTNLRQIGLALQGYVNCYGALPPAGWDWETAPPPGPRLDHSMKARLLGFIDQEPLFDAINFSLPVDPYQRAGVYLDNVTACSTRVAAFLCPSDAEPAAWPFANLAGVDFDVASTNYPNNMGVTPTYTGLVENGPAYFLNPSRWSRGVIGIADVTDGTSQAAMFSEYLKSAGAGRDPLAAGNRLRTVFWIDWATKNGTPGGDSLACQAADLIQGDYKGEYWAQHDPGRGGGYFHTNPPNTKSCNGGYVPYGWVGVSSLHPGGVNVLFLDGSVHFIKDDIDYRTWLALGTIAGGEIIGTDR